MIATGKLAKKPKPFRGFAPLPPYFIGGLFPFYRGLFNARGLNFRLPPCPPAREMNEFEHYLNKGRRNFGAKIGNHEHK